MVYDDYSAEVTIEADVAEQTVTLRVSCQLAHGEPSVLYATGAEVRGAGEGSLVVGDVLPAGDVTEAMIADVESVLVDIWTDVEAA